MENKFDYQYDVFICHASKDYYIDEKTKEVIPDNVISAIMERFDDSGIHYWIDVKNNMVGKTVNPTLAENIYKSMAFLFVCSRNSVVSDNVRTELDVAANYKKTIITFDCDGSYLNTNVVMHTVSSGRIEFSGNLNSDMEKLVETIKQYKKEFEEKRKKEEEIIKQRQKEEEERKKREEQARKKKETIKEIRQLANDYRMRSLQQEDILLQLHEKNLSIGIQTKECPVCKITSPIDSTFCEKCGFQFPPLYAIDGNERYRFDKRHLAIAKSNYDTIALVKNEKDNLEEKAGELEKQKKRLETELERVKSQIVTDSVQQDLIIPVKDLSIVMKPVEGGTFWMGAQKTDLNGQNYDGEAFDDESPVHSVMVDSFYMCETVVTQALWKAVMGSEPTYKDRWEKRYGKGVDYPVYRVSYNDIVMDFLPKLNQMTGENFRLPTEAEWEYAARGGQNSKTGYKYSGGDDIDRVAWYKGNSCDKTHPVKEKQSNELKLYDLSGNVWEWCGDAWYNYKSSEEANPVFEGESDSARMLRGGSWYGIPGHCRVSTRYYLNPSYGRYNIGFRLVLPL